MRILTLLAVVPFVIAAPDPANAYRFYPRNTEDSPVITSAAHAVRWETANLRFHLQRNIPHDFLNELEWRTIVQESLAAWSSIKTADIRLSLASGFVAGETNLPRGIDFDGQLTIGWTSVGPDSPTLGYASFHFPNGQMRDCDIYLNVNGFRELLKGRIDNERLPGLATLQHTVMHEIGHCLGLAHTEPHPIAGWLIERVTAPPIPRTFLPDTLMSYSAARSAYERWLDFQLTAEDVLSEDDRIGVSLLYPKAPFPMLRGSVAGQLVLEQGGAASFAYVQAVYPGSVPGMGPGAFSDSGGYFHLDGLEPGPVQLWIHPILIHGSNPHGDLLPLAEIDVVDQWEWISTTVDHVTIVPDIELAAGRPR